MSWMRTRKVMYISSRFSEDSIETVNCSTVSHTTDGGFFVENSKFSKFCQ